jgi:hypothetical protein
MSGALIGGMIGSFFGGPIGYMLGSMIGGALFPTKAEGPKLGDLKPQSSEYGRPLPIVYGTMALGGSVIWASEFTIVAGEGGKGGETPTGDTAYGNFAVAICEGGEDLQLGHIWAGLEKRLFWDGLTVEGGATIRFYNGSEDQLPDPLIESFEGVGNVPAYRGTAYIVIENMNLLKDGNRLPFLTIEIGRITTIEAPEDMGEVWVSQVITTDQYWATFYYGSYYGVVIRRLSDDSLYRHYTYDIVDWDTSPVWFWDQDRQLFVKRGDMEYTTMPIATGVQTSHPILAASGADSDLGTSIKGSVYHNGFYIFAASGSAVTGRVTLYLMDPDSHDPLFTFAANSGASGALSSNGLMKPAGTDDPWVYCLSTDKLTLHHLSSAAVVLDLGAPAPAYAHRQAAVDPYTGYIWSVSQAIGTGTIDVRVSDPAIAPVPGWPAPPDGLIYSATLSFPAALGASIITFVPGTPNKVIITGEQWLGIDYYMVLNADTPGVLSQDAGGYHGSANVQSLFYQPTAGLLYAIRQNGWVTMSDTADDPWSANYLIEGSFAPELDNWYLGQDDATLSPSGQALSEIVLDLSLRAGLTEDQVDVTQLEDDIVDGYAVANQTTVRDAITALMPYSYFDMYESEGKVKAVKRGGAVVRVIPDEDVGCFVQGSEPVEPMDTVRAKENDLPRTLNVRYISAATDYATAARSAKRLIGASGEEKTLDFPIVMTDTKAQEVAEVNLHGAWVARLSYSFTLPRKHADLEPTDVITVLGYTMRLTKTIQDDGIIKCEAEADATATWTPKVVVRETVPGEGAGGGGGGEVIVTSETILELA